MPCTTLYSKPLPQINIPEWRPKIIVSCAISLDGKIASSQGDTRLSSYDDKVEVHKLRSNVDAILVGINTILADDPHLTVSEKYYQSEKHPVRVVLDSTCRIPPEAKVITKRPEVPTVIATSQKAPKEKIAMLKSLGVDVLVTSMVDKVCIRDVLKYLKEKYGVETMMVEGGGAVIGEFLRLGFVDLLRISVTPVLFGEGAVSVIRNVSFGRIEDSPKLRLYKIEKCGHNIVLYFYVERTINYSSSSSKKNL